jgi:hypothetical protein
VVLRFVAVASVAVLLSACSRAGRAPLVISQSSAGAYEAALQLRDGGFVAAWYDTRDGNAEIYMRLLDEQGVPSGPERRLTSGPEESNTARIAVFDNGVAVAWYDKSVDGGACRETGCLGPRWPEPLGANARRPRKQSCDRTPRGRLVLRVDRDRRGWP